MGRARLPVKGARGPSLGKAIAQARWDNLAIQPRTDGITLQFSRGQFCPRQTQRPTKERGKSGIGLSLKENLKYLWKAALTTI